MLRNEMWDRGCNCDAKFVPHLGAFLTYAAAVMTFWILGDSEIDLLIEVLPVISSEFGFSVFIVALGILYCKIMYVGARVIEFRCDAMGHGGSSQEE